MRIERLEMVSSFEIDETILLTAGREIKKLQNQLEGRVMQLHVPDPAPPEIPRMVIQSKGFVLNICQNRFQFIVSPPDHVAGSYTETMEYVSTQVRPRLKALFLSGVSYVWTGLIQTVNFPLDLTQYPDAMAAATPAIRRLLKLDWQAEELASFNLQIGKKRESFYHTFWVSGYATKTVEIKLPKQDATIQIDGSAGKLEETGIQVQVDVNNKPAAGSGEPIEDFDVVLDEHRTVFEEMPEALGLSEII